MRTAINVVVILAVGLGIGLALRMVPPSADAERAVTERAVTERTVTERTSTEGTSGDDSGVIRPVAKPKPPSEPSGSADATAGDSQAVASDASGEEAWLTRFTLTERSGEEIASEELKGQPYVVSFFFSTCPSVCVMQNQKIQQLQTEFEGQGVRFVAISVDPETDTPEKLREYARRYKADEDQWLFLTGDLTYIRRVAGEIYGVHADKAVHTEKLILVDSSGEIVGYYAWTEDRQFDQLKKDIRTMLESGGKLG